MNQPTPTTAPLLAELYAAAEQRQSTPTNQNVGWPLTPKEMHRWDAKSRLDWSQFS